MTHMSDILVKALTTLAFGRENMSVTQKRKAKDYTSVETQTWKEWHEEGELV